MASKREFHIFFSYRSKDEARVDEFRDMLIEHYKQAGTTIHVWMAKYDMAGSPAEEMSKNLKKSDIVILFLSQDYEKSQYCMAEANMAYQRNKPLVVLLMQQNYDPTENDELFTIISRSLRHRAYDKTSLVAEKDKIFMEVDKILAKY